MPPNLRSFWFMTAVMMLVFLLAAYLSSCARPGAGNPAYWNALAKEIK
jgi:hypothetical protein